MIKRYAWVIVFLLFLVYMINYFDRTALSIMLSLIELDLNLNKEQFGYIMGSFFAGYALFNFIGGLATDRYGPKIVLGLAVFFWSLFCGLTAFATGFYSMLFLRLLFGMAEGPICSSANKMINCWFPKKEAATAMGYLSAGSPLGGVISGPIIGAASIYFGWRHTFIIICLVGLVWLVAWHLFASDLPEANRYISAEEKNEINSVKAQEEQAELASRNVDGEEHSIPTILQYFKDPIIQVTAFAFFCYNYLLFFFLSWFPDYLISAHHLDIKAMSITNVIPWVVGFIGLSSGGYISDYIFRITGNALFSRRLMISCCLFIAAVCVALAGIVSSLVPAVVLMSASVFFLYVTGAIYWAIIQDTVHRSKVGSLSGFIHLIGSLSGIAAPIITGYIAQRDGEFTYAFVLAGIIVATGAILSWFFIRNKSESKNPITKISEING